MYDEKNESIHIALKEQRNLMHIESKEQRELIHIKEEKNKLEKVKVEEEIIKKDISNMDFEQKEHIRPLRLEILERFKSKLTSYLNVITNI